MFSGLQRFGGRRLLGLLAISSAFSAGHLEATQCTIAHGFEATARQADLVAVVRVLRHAPKERFGSRRPMSRFMHASITRVLAGVEESGEIRIWGAGPNIYDLRPPIDNFDPGTTWILALRRISRETAQRNAELHEGDYTFPQCDISSRPVRESPEDETYMRALAEQLKR